MNEIFAELSEIEKVSVWGCNETMKNAVRIAMFYRFADAVYYIGFLSDELPGTTFTIIDDRDRGK